MKKLIAVLMLILIMTAGCTSNQAYSEAEIGQIVDTALNKGELANLLYLGEFNQYKRFAYQAENDLEYSTVHESDTLPLFCNDNIWALLQTFSSTDDIKDYMRSVFTPDLAEQYLADMFTPNCDKYIFHDGQFMQCEQLATYPLSLIQWQHQPSAIITNQKNKLTVTLKGRFILTGTETELPFDLAQHNGEWLLDASFSPQEQQPADYYYSQSELQNILENTLAKAEIANKLHAADSLPAVYKSVFKYNNTNYLPVDRNSPDNDDYDKLAKEITTTAQIKQCFQDAFVPEMAQKYIDELFDDRDAPLYIDTPQGLAYWGEVACMPITFSQWQTDDYCIWQNCQEQIIVIIGAKEHYPGYGYYPLRLRLVDGKWLCDATYENYSSYFSWDIAE